VTITSVVQNRTFYRDRHDALADVRTRVRDWSGDIAGGSAIVLGSAGFSAVKTTTSLSPDGTLFTFESWAVANIVITNTEDSTATDNLVVADSLAACLVGSGYGVAIVPPRTPRYTAADESQKVIFNPAVGAVGASITWEETAKPGFLNGVHPGNGVITLPLGTIDPTAYDANTAPLMFRIQPGRGFVVTSAKVRSLTPIATAGDATIDLVRDDAASLATAPVNLETLVSGTLTAITLEAAAADRTIAADGYLDIVIELDDFTGTAGDVTVELEVELA
jgi:hypothetical protein